MHEHQGRLFELVGDLEIVLQGGGRNRKAFHAYDIFEAGMVLIGSEVKYLRAGKANLKEGFAKITNGEVFLYNVRFPPPPPLHSLTC